MSQDDFFLNRQLDRKLPIAWAKNLFTDSGPEEVVASSVVNADFKEYDQSIKPWSDERFMECLDKLGLNISLQSKIGELQLDSIVTAAVASAEVRDNIYVRDAFSHYINDNLSNLLHGFRNIRQTFEPLIWPSQVAGDGNGE